MYCRGMTSEPDVADTTALAEALHAVASNFGPGVFARVEASSDPAVPSVVAGFREDELGRQVLTHLFLTSDALTADDLRGVSIRDLERRANNDGVRHDLVGLDEKGELLVAIDFRRSNRGDQDEFARRFAEIYRRRAQISPSPAADISREYDLPRPTVHSWVREARLKGFLPPAERRKSASSARE